MVHKHVVETVLRAGANRDASVLLEEPWGSLEEHISSEMIMCLISFVQVSSGLSFARAVGVSNVGDLRILLFD